MAAVAKAVDKAEMSTDVTSTASEPEDIEHANEKTPLVASLRGELKKTTSDLSEDECEPLPSPFNLVPWLDDLGKVFGYKLLGILFASQHLLKGFVASLIGPATQYLLSAYNVEGPQMQIYGGIIGLPWAMKPVIGLISDGLPLNGYNKGPYIAITCLLGLAAFITVGHSASTVSVELIVGCLFVMQLQASTCDLLTEAKYAEKMQRHPTRGPDLMTYVWFGLQFFGLLATCLVGPILEKYGPRAVFLIALVPASFILVPVMRNYLEEKPQTPDQVAEMRRKLTQQKEACVLCVLMFAGTILLTVLGIGYKDVHINCIAALCVAAVMLIAFSVVLHPLIAKVNAFFLLQTSLGFSIGGATFYFYTDDETAYKEGPHFSMSFYTSVLGIVGSLCSLLGIYTYQRYMKDWKYRQLLLMTNVTLSFLSIADVIMLSRLNKKWGIPDHIFVLGASVFQTVIGQWMWMPGVVIMSQLCPKGMEATMYALLAVCHNLGNTIASSTGALVLVYLGCEPAGHPNEDAQFKNLWIGAVISTVLPMLTLCLLPILIPDARQTDKLLGEEDRDATAGSLWKSWWVGSA